MKREPFKYTFGEFIDKLSIVSKKDLSGLKGANTELAEIMDWLNDVGVNAHYLLSIIRIAQANMDIWNLEHEMRNDTANSMPLHIVGARAIRIRDHNKTRVRYKNELDSICGDTHVEEKIQHLSEETYDKFYNKPEEIDNEESEETFSR